LVLKTCSTSIIEDFFLVSQCDRQKAFTPTTAKKLRFQRQQKAFIPTTAQKLQFQRQQKSFYFNDSNKVSIPATAKKLVLLSLVLFHDLVLGNIMFNVGHPFLIMFP
jgi:hypothetical protein